MLFGVYFLCEKPINQSFSGTLVLNQRLKQLVSAHLITVTRIELPRNVYNLPQQLDLILPMRIPKLLNLLLPDSLIHHIPYFLLIILHLLDLDIRR